MNAFLLCFVIPFFPQRFVFLGLFSDRHFVELQIRQLFTSVTKGRPGYSWNTHDAFLSFLKKWPPTWTWGIRRHFKRTTNVVYLLYLLEFQTMENLNSEISTKGEGEACYGIVSNIPKEFRSADLRAMFSNFINGETEGFKCFHFRHRPEFRCEALANGEDKEVQSSNTACCVIMISKKQLKELIKDYHGKNWVDRNGKYFPSKAVISKIRIKEGKGSYLRAIILFTPSHRKQPIRIQENNCILSGMITPNQCALQSYSCPK